MQIAVVFSNSSVSGNFVSLIVSQFVTEIKMSLLNEDKIYDLIDLINDSHCDFAESVTTLYINQAYSVIGFPNFKSFCTETFPSISYSMLFEHAKAGEIALSLSLPVGKNSNSSLLAMRKLHVDVRYRVWRKVCENLKIKSKPSPESVTKKFVEQCISETVDAPKSGPTKDVDSSRLKEALTVKDEKAIAKIIFTLIDDEELVQALIEDLENCLIELEESEEEL